LTRWWGRRVYMRIEYSIVAPDNKILNVILSFLSARGRHYYKGKLTYNPPHPPKFQVFFFIFIFFQTGLMSRKCVMKGFVSVKMEDWARWRQRLYMKIYSRIRTTAVEASFSIDGKMFFTFFFNRRCVYCTVLNRAIKLMEHIPPSHDGSCARGRFPPSSTEKEKFSPSSLHDRHLNNSKITRKNWKM
jgi:hypothetical protein